MPQNWEICTSTCTCVQRFEQGKFYSPLWTVTELWTNRTISSRKGSCFTVGISPIAAGPLQTAGPTTAAAGDADMLLLLLFWGTGACGVLMFNSFRKTTINGIGLFVYKNLQARVQFPRPVAFDVTVNMNAACPDIEVLMTKRTYGTVFVKRENFSWSNVWYLMVLLVVSFRSLWSVLRESLLTPLSPIVLVHVLFRIPSQVPIVTYRWQILTVRRHILLNHQYLPTALCLNVLRQPLHMVYPTGLNTDRMPSLFWQKRYTMYENFVL